MTAEGGVIDRVTEALTCFALAMREATRPGLALMSLLLGLAALIVWGIVFFVWWADIRALLVTLSSAVLGSHASGPKMSAFLGYALGLLAYMLVVMATVRLLLELLLMSRIQKYCLKRYPQLQRGAESSLLSGVWESTLGAVIVIVGGLLCLIIPVIGAALFFLLVSYFNARSLVNDALDGLASNEQRRALLKTQRLELAVLGVAGSLFMLVPVIGFVGPVALGAGVCHLGMRSLLRDGSAAA